VGVVGHVEVGDRVEVEVAVAVRVEEGAADGPDRIVDAAGLADVGEARVAVVEEQARAAVGAHVDVPVAVGVHVADREALRVEGDVEPAARGHVLEGPVTQVAVEAVALGDLVVVATALLERELVGGQRAALQEQEVGQLVAVEVRGGHARAHRLEQVLAPDAAVHVHEVDAGGLGHVGERRRAAAGSGVAAARGEAQQADVKSASRVAGPVHGRRPAQ
jgi:hypothetical protein